MAQFRKKRFVSKSIQAGLTGSFITVAVVCALLQVVLVNRSLGQLAGELGEPQVFLEALPSLLMSNLGITLAVLVPAMWFFGVLVTHRIAGPVYRLERYLEGIARGEYEGPCKVRKGDELQELCDKLNRAVDRLRADGCLAESDEEEAERAA